VERWTGDTECNSIERFIIVGAIEYGDIIEVDGNSRLEEARRDILAGRFNLVGYGVYLMTRDR